MSEDNKKLFKYLGIVFIAVLLTYKLPHDSYSIIQYIIRPIRYKNSVIYLSGIIPLAVFIIGIKGILSLERFADKRRILIFLLIVTIIIPIMNWSLDFTRTNYHWLKRDGLNAVDIVDTDINLNGSNEELTINFKLELIDYSRSQNEFKIRVYLPKSLSDYVGKDFYEFEKHYRTYGNRSILNVKEQIVVRLDNDYTRKSSFDSQWYWEDVEYQLYNKKEVVKIMEHGF
ncbi:hypothetical protein OW763_11970 [Clostridium aestuarii]|uniref:Uncharacterized protein n=1 Tax=Clostridium aestuarii TaxID=338193 RepID=A0ABT4D1D4_9CLOT|nr:hypothetical protein [Clostridium aestuarii]MCY6485057.1 hypothetical protein [Clostridium aestuarii]